MLNMYCFSLGGPRFRITSDSVIFSLIGKQSSEYFMHRWPTRVIPIPMSIKAIAHAPFLIHMATMACYLEEVESE